MARQQYYIEFGRGGKWQREETRWRNPESFYDLDAHIKKAQGYELHEGKYQVRVVGEDGVVYAHFVDPYDAPRLNLANFDIDDLRRTYGISQADFMSACRRWLENHSS